MAIFGHAVNTYEQAQLEYRVTRHELAVLASEWEYELWLKIVTILHICFL